MNPDFGKRLTAARTARGLSVEEAAQATRMRPSHIEALEAAHLARFPNSAYAKSFLVMYARFLDVEMGDVAGGIDTATQMKVEDFQYLTNRAREDRELKRAATDTRYDFVVPEKIRSWTPLFIGGAAVAAAVIALIVWNNVNRLRTNDDKPSTPAAAGTSEKPETPPPPAVARAVPATPVPDAEAPPPKPRIISMPEGAVPVAQPVVRGEPAIEPEIPRAKPISPVATIAASDGAALDQLPTGAPRAIPAAPATVAAMPVPEPPPVEEDNSALDADPNTVVIEPQRKAWVVIRNGPGGQLLYEDFLYPTARAMRLPAGRYFIELKEPDAIEITRNGKRIAYTPPGILVE